MIFKALLVWASVLVLTKCSTNSSVSSVDLNTNERFQKIKESIKNMEAIEETLSESAARDESSDQNPEISFGPNDSLHSLSNDDITKIHEIENYYKHFSTKGLLEQPDPDEILKHRIFLSKILNHVKLTKKTDSRLSSNLKELLSTMASISVHSSLNPANHSTIIVETNKNHSIKGLLSDDTSKIDVKSNTTSEKSRIQRYNSKSPVLSKDNQTQLKSADDRNSKDSSNPTFSKRYGELSSKYPYSSKRHQSSLHNVYQSPTLASILLPQEIKRKRGAMRINSISQSIWNTENITESPLAITDTAALEEDISKKLLELLIQAYTQGGSASNYNDMLESALAELTQTTSSTVNKNVQAFATPIGTAPLGNGPGLVEGMSPEVLASLLVTLELPTTEELTKLQNQLSNLVKLVGQDTRLQTVDPATLQDILMSIATAIINIITGITMLCTTNPLICILTAVAISALLFHLYKHKYGKKKYTYKDSGHGHDSGGYHRKNFYDYDTYRMLDEDTQAEVTSDILGKIDVFDDWIKSVKDFQ